jgi:D-glycero-beta-D-manno-heptose-7-phosphate kinase
MIKTDKLRKIISKFPKAKILVVGDLILDQYIWGDVSRISPEAPVPVVWAKKREYIPGGAANVANNLKALNAEVCLAGVVGDDEHAKKLKSGLIARGIDTKGIFREKGRCTTLKTRVLAGHQQVVRVDWEHVYELKKETRNLLQDFIQKHTKDFDAVIIEDYGKGCLDQFILQILIREAKNDKKIITVDPKEDNFEYYKEATCITPNRKETQNAIRYLKMRDTENKFKIINDELITDGDIQKAGKDILEYLELQSLLITLGENGMWLFEKGHNEHIPTVAREVFDVSGAGDTVIATFTLALACGATKPEAAYIANFAAGIVVGKLGTATTTRDELTERLIPRSS